jgi:hypothetical protein
MTATGPTPTSLPPAPPGDFFDATQWTVLTALLDAIIPSIVPASAVVGSDDSKTHRGIDDGQLEHVTAQVRSTMVSPPSPELFKAYLEERPSANPALREALRRTLSTVPASSRRKLGGALTTLS